MFCGVSMDPNYSNFTFSSTSLRTDMVDSLELERVSNYLDDLGSTALETFGIISEQYMNKLIYTQKNN